MALGALLDVGVSLSVIEDALESMSVRGRVSLEPSQAQRAGVTGTFIDVRLDAKEQGNHSFQDFIQTVQGSGLSERVKLQSVSIFRRLADAEARVHRTTAQELHLHELGTLDTLIDVVGSVAGLESLGVERVFSSPFPMGSGVFRSAHGMLPVPSPATSALFAMADAPVRSAPGNPAWTGEMVTPTGAAILTTLAEFRQPVMRMSASGYGLGARDPQEYPNALGLWIGEVADRPVRVDGLSLIETNIDDCSGEVLGYVQERLFAIGARDVWFAPIQMKKNRPATLLCALVAESDEERAVELIMRETTTLGVRVRPVTRYEAERDIVSVDTSLGSVSVKVKKLDGTPVSAAPEYEDCRRIADATGRPLLDVFHTVRQEAEARLGIRSQALTVPSGVH